MNRISIIIVNYKTPFQTINCIDSLINHIQKTFEYEIIVVDNNSSDGSSNTIQNHNKAINCIENALNVGFGEANNIGYRASSGKYILLINSDVIIDNEKTITTCINTIEQDDQIGVIGCKMINQDGSIQNFTSTIARYRKILDRNLFFAKFFPEKKYEIEAVMGAFMLIPSNVMKLCGGFDSDFFMYSEEIDLCHRIQKLGYKIVLLENVSVLHENGGSTPNRKWANKQSKLSTALLFYKVHGFLGYVLYHLISLLNILTNSFLMWFLNKQYRKDFLKDSSLYFSGFLKYFSIPFYYTRKPGKGKRQLIAKP